MAARSLFVLAAFAVVALVVSTPPTSPRFIDLDPWAWLPTRRTKSASIMDYFFPPSRTPKVSNLEASPPAPVFVPTSSPSSAPATATTTAATATDRTAPATAQDARATTAARKTSTVGKTKTSATQTTPKVKIIPKITTQYYTGTETRATKVEKVEKPTTVIPSQNKSSTAKKAPSSTPKPTKHYTIMPVRSTTLALEESTQTTFEAASQTSVTLDTTETEETSASEYTGKTTPTATAVEAAQTSPVATSTRVTAAESRATAGTTHAASDATATEATVDSTTTPDNTTDELDSREGYLPLRDKPHQTHVKINDQTKKESVPLPAGSTSVLAKPTKYHYYPHNQHIYLLPECAIQQVCNAVYVRLNYTQPLCACPSRYRDPCSASLNADDLHTTRLTTDSKKKFAARAVTLVKTCEAVSEMRECRAPRDWSLLALQNIRTGKSHYLVICRCPENHILEGPMSHDQPTYASVPGIRVYGMMCVRPSGSSQYQTSGYNANRYTAVSIQTTTNAYKLDYSQPHYNQDKPMYNRYPSHSYLGPNTYYNRMNRAMRTRRHIQRDYPPFPWHKVQPFAQTIHWDQ